MVYPLDATTANRRERDREDLEREKQINKRYFN
jgi:hypothetical protein